MSQRVLVIEDDEESRDLLKQVLEGAGFEVEAHGDGDAGLKAASDRYFDAVVCDLLLPRRHGYEVIREMRGNWATRRVPIVVVTGQIYPADRRKAVELGAQAFLSKPFRNQEVIETVRSVIDSVRVRFWGVRGSIAAPGPETVRYGGNTPCVTIERGRDLLILDAGTGARKLGLCLQAEARGAPLEVQMLVTHTHWDHIQGFPFFTPAYVPGNHVQVYGPPSVEKPLEKVLNGQMDSAYFPVALGDMAGKVSVTEIRTESFTVGPFEIEARYVNHPGITMAFRVTIGDKVVVYATDTEPYKTLMGDGDYGARQDEGLAGFIANADVYIADSQYTPKDYETKRGWGHTCYIDAVKMALSTQVKKLVLFSHDPMHDDDMVDAKLAECRAMAEGKDLQVEAAIEGSTLEA